jgi:hypothetical protein
VGGSHSWTESCFAWALKKINEAPRKEKRRKKIMNVFLRMEKSRF